MAQSINNLNLEKFLKCGAFIRVNDNKFILFCGPWKTSDNSDTLLNNNSADISLAQFFGSRLKLVQASNFFVADLIDLQNALQSKLRSARNDVYRGEFSAANFDNFEMQFQNVMGKIHRGEIDKAVPVMSVSRTGKPSDSCILNWMFHLLSMPSSLYPFGFWDENFGIIGATPEILFHKKGKLVRSVALAGTCPRSQISTRTPLLKDEKELHEHRLVVKDIEGQLSRLGRVKKSSTRILELPSLLHLLTELEVEGTSVQTEELIKMLHPTCALGVSPRAYGYQWLSELPEQKERNLFGSPICFTVGEDEFLCLVAIRNIQWTQEKMTVFAGCGLIKESQLDREWNEIQSKINSVFDQLGM